MADLRKCLEEAGYSQVRTVLASGNVVFDAKTAQPSAIEHRIEKVIEEGLGRFFGSTVRTAEHLQTLIESNPFSGFDLDPEAKLVVTFLRRPASTMPQVPMERDGVRILKHLGTEVFTAYVPNEKGPVFMNMLERAFGREITTRTFETVKKCARA